MKLKKPSFQVYVIVPGQSALLITLSGLHLGYLTRQDAKTLMLKQQPLGAVAKHDILLLAPTWFRAEWFVLEFGGLVALRHAPCPVARMLKLQ
jgi:hypothetical protein